MSQAPAQPRDPLGLSLLMALAFTLLAGLQLTTPSKPFFDEVHYLPAAREMLANGSYINREHPLLGKELIALGIAIFGNNPLGWRVFSLLAGALALFASMRAMWFGSLSRFASLAFGLLLASGFMLFVQSRIAMLDIYMAAFLCVATWQFAGAIREPETGRWRLIATGAALGAAMASKWNAIPLAIVPGIAFLLARLSAGRRRLLTSQRGIPVPGVSLLEATLWLGVLPLAVYAATFIPAYHFRDTPFATQGLIEFHREMYALQTQVLEPHPYQSNWPDWALNLRAIWYLYEAVDGAQRGVLLVGNPLTMMLGLPALIWCALTGNKQRQWARIGVVAGYAVSLGLWLFASKSVQFYYHYFLPHFFLLGALALALDALWQGGHRKLALLVLAASLVLFAYFYPILSAAALEGPQSFLNWSWIDGWR
ncbi:phospholipid carrier-dependent glycosyltransferase [Altererythrobacter arenosus]|uniref:Polyprenol-phosphate-mannose--protein mannosyltransferase n=1 Tax=Altererythrobacter arenosus TaxID=3032592 RepID=A0ABY8FNL0_9SPHN|nr:phospholipid carrier-dependent glycosyltransferase [Altererythrobacter sp. CAU 1644]WFL76603.1 phospholipid carrier-dependent glycosyltransferase [Altererythrobacter sp. CAU 1644]